MMSWQMLDLQPKEKEKEKKKAFIENYFKKIYYIFSSDLLRFVSEL